MNSNGFMLSFKSMRSIFSHSTCITSNAFISTTTKLRICQITTKRNKGEDQGKEEEEEDEHDIFKTHYIPGKYIHLLKKNRRQLKKEARQKKNRFGNEKLVRIPSRQNLGNSSNLLIIDEQTKELHDDDTNKNEDVSIYTKKKNDLTQRITSAIRKSNEEVPHMYMSNSFVKIDDIIVSDNLKAAKVWWRPLLQDGVSGPEIERCFQSYKDKYCSILKRYMRLKKTPRLTFMRSDLVSDGILNVLENLETEMKFKQQQQQQQQEKDDDKNLIG